MATPPTIHYNPRGYEATYDPASDACEVAVRGFIDANGKIVERGGPAYPDDKVLARFTLDTSCVKLAASPCAKLAVSPKSLAPTSHNPSMSFAPTSLSSNVRDTFHDALADHHDLLGAPVFRHKPTDDAERRLFAAAYDAAQKVRSNSTILGVDKLIFSLNPGLFALVDCFTRDNSGAFWLMSAESKNQPNIGQGSGLPEAPSVLVLALAAYVLEAGEYVPAGGTVRLGVWSILPTGPRFAEAPNDRIAARDAVISHLLKTPF